MSVAALSLAVTPAALTGVAAGRPWAAVAVVAACGAVVLAWSAAGGWASAIIASSAVAAGVAAWALDTPDRFTSPTWGEAFNRTGQVLWTSVGRVDLAVLVPTTGWLVWWIGAGAIAGAALIVGDSRAAAIIPTATATMVAAAWVIIHCAATSTSPAACGSRRVPWPTPGPVAARTKPAIVGRLPRWHSSWRTCGSSPWWRWRGTDHARRREVRSRRARRP